MDKKLFLISVIIVAVFTGIYYSPLIKNKQGDNTIVLILDYGNNKKQSFKLSTEEPYRVWSLLQQVAAVSNTILVPDNNFYPQKIDSPDGDIANKNWNFYVDGIKQEKSPFETMVSPPAEIIFRLE